MWVVTLCKTGTHCHHPKVYSLKSQQQGVWMRSYFIVVKNPSAISNALHFTLLLLLKLFSWLAVTVPFSKVDELPRMTSTPSGLSSWRCYQADGWSTRTEHQGSTVLWSGRSHIPRAKGGSSTWWIPVSRASTRLIKLEGQPIALHCLDPEAKLRPEMNDVVRELEQVSTLNDHHSRRHWHNGHGSLGLRIQTDAKAGLLILGLLLPRFLPHGS